MVFNIIKFVITIEITGVPIPYTKLACLNFSIHLKLRGYAVPSIVLTPFYTDDEVSWLWNTELLPRWAASPDLRHLGLKRYPL